jgi:hypothetical protein
MIIKKEIQKKDIPKWPQELLYGDRAHFSKYFLYCVIFFICANLQEKLFFYSCENSAKLALLFPSLACEATQIGKWKFKSHLEN